MFKEFCTANLMLLKKYKRNRDELMFNYVSERLAKSLKTYDDELEDSLKYLERRKQLNLIRKISKK